MSFLLFQDRGKIGDNRNGVADLLGDTVEEDFLPVGTDLVPGIGGGPIRQGLRGAELQGACRFFHRDGVNRIRGVHVVVEFFTVVTPAGPIAPFRRDLPFAGSALEGNDINLRQAGFIGHVRQPSAVRRKSGADT